ncbi:glycosyltransferase [Thioalkalivibrio sulfidiphilus]|uniref:glycosyltransferase family protein n=1 Tax=Thioalkalivibrio sulfidiphilus TaxID=1033854 RepID=UPI000182835B|nr:glycosyltransferase [Thioalkalivibrio sulfidiphilus]
MYPRRLVEILACGGIAVTTPAKSVEAMFADDSNVVANAEHARDLFERLRYGPSTEDLECARAGAEYLLREHSWSQRIERIREVVGV